MGLPATVSVPAVMELATVIFVLAKLKLASEAQLPSVAPVAAPRTGNVSTGVGEKKAPPPLPPPPQADNREVRTTRESEAGVFKNVSFDARKWRHLVSLFNYGL
jgi:hypothetical protein